VWNVVPRLKPRSLFWRSSRRSVDGLRTAGRRLTPLPSPRDEHCQGGCENGRPKKQKPPLRACRSPYEKHGTRKHEDDRLELDAKPVLLNPPLRSGRPPRTAVSPDVLKIPSLVRHGLLPGH
jgi:hypothetical protein